MTNRDKQMFGLAFISRALNDGTVHGGVSPMSLRASCISPQLNYKVNSIR